MKIIMYHYVQKFNKKFPYQNFLDIDHFKKQINLFIKKYGIISNENEIFNENKKILLTFDDGFKHHFKIAKFLKKRKIIGIFFICARTLLKKDILPVHKVHLILSKINPYVAHNSLLEILKKDKIIIRKNNISKFKNIYKKQNDIWLKKEFKKIINYFLDEQVKNKILDKLMKQFKINMDVKNFYLNNQDLKKMQKLGMIIGSHGYSHNLLSKLDLKDQKKEIYNSKIILEKILKKKVNFFCFPYGGSISYNNNTINILKESGYKLSFDVISKNTTIKNIKKNPFKIPRFDCNQF